MNLKALIIGASGQDGSFLTKYLLSNGYKCICSSRKINKNTFQNHKKINVVGNVTYVELNPEKYDDVYRILKLYNPNEIYNLSGQSSVGKSFRLPYETYRSITLPTINILESIRNIDPLGFKFYSAKSSECFGDNGYKPINEKTKYRSTSPYSAAKISAANILSVYRESYNIFACNGFLFNHESSLRGEDFLTKKIIKSVVNIVNKKQDVLEVGNISISRDWGYAKDYVIAMNKMLTVPKKPMDFVIGTGNSHTIEDFIRKVFKYFNLNYKNYIITNQKFVRKNEPIFNVSDPTKAYKILGWKSQTSFNDLIEILIQNELRKT